MKTFSHCINTRFLLNIPIICRFVCKELADLQVYAKVITINRSHFFD